jgi:HEAT repeat protein
MPDSHTKDHAPATARQRVLVKASEQDVPELPAIKQLLALLDKTFKTARTYGPHNPVAQRFYQQFYRDLTAHLDAYESVLFLVQRSELYYNGYSVYQASSPTENLAFKLHADGIRELALHKGLSQSDLSFLLEALGGTYDPEVSDDDIVTRLWEKNLATISFVTAEETLKSSEMANYVTPQDMRTLNSPVSNLRHVVSTETSRNVQDEPLSPASLQPVTVLVGYDVVPQEQEKLAQDVEAESSRDNTAYLLDMLTAILASEQSNPLLEKLLDLFAEVLDTLTKQGDWKLLNTIVGLLHESQDLCPNLGEEHKKKLAGLLDSMGSHERMKAIEGALHADPDSPIEDLQALLLLLKPTAVPALCTLMANLKQKSHRLMVCEVLTQLAKQNPSQLARGLSDPRWYYVRNLVYIIGKVNNPQLTKSLEPLSAHQDVRVRKEVLKTLRTLCPSGPADRFVVFLNDHEESIRLLAIKILTTGQYTAPFKVWSPIVTPKAFQDRSLSEKRGVFEAMCRAAGDEIVPYCVGLVTRWFWTNRKVHQEAAVLAAEALGKVGTPAAVQALEIGKKRMNRIIRQACTKALAMHTQRHAT